MALVRPNPPISRSYRARADKYRPASAIFRCVEKFAVIYLLGAGPQDRDVGALLFKLYLLLFIYNLLHYK